VGNAELGQILPHIGNFGGTDYPVDLGFMA
jgi:hypothetical protein